MSKNLGFIPLAVPEIGSEEINNVVKCLRSGWLTTGKFNFEFERLLREYLGTKEVICLDSCTSALHLSLRALGIGKGDEVITTPLTFAATANVIVHCAARPVFCDVNEYTCNIDPDQIRKKITKRTRAVIPVHFAGYPCDQERIYKLADHYGIEVIEDAAHALSSAVGDKRIGSFPGITCFSFYATKNITTGEGGCVALDNKKIAEKIRILRFHGISKDAWQRYARAVMTSYEIVQAGYKNNMTDVLASIGVAQIKKAETFRKKRQMIADKYNKAFDSCPGLTLPCNNPGMTHSWHLYACRINKKKFGIDRDQFMSFMLKRGIATSVHYIPIHLHSYYRKSFGYMRGQFPVAEKIGSEIVSIPLYTKMKPRDINRVILSILSIKRRSHS